MSNNQLPHLLILNQMAGPMTWELAEDLGKSIGPVALLTGHPDTLAKGSSAAVWLSPAVSYQRGGYARRGLSWLGYIVQAFFWLWRWQKTIPLLLFSNPPILVWLGYGMKMVRGQPYAVMVHDIYPDTLVALKGFSPKNGVIRLWNYFNKKAYENADVVMTLGECMATNLEKQFDQGKTRAGRVQVIPPWVDTEKIKPIPKEENRFAQKYDQVGKLTVMYSGIMGWGHDIETMVDAARRLQDVPNLHFMFVGEGPKWRVVEEAIQTHRLTNVTLLPWQSEEMLPWVLATADIGLVSLEDNMQGLAIPSKAFYMMSAGAALLGLSKRPSDLQSVIEQNQCGINVEPGEVDGFVKGILRFCDDGGFLNHCRQSVRVMAECKFSRQANVAKVRYVIADLLYRQGERIG